MPGYSRLPVPAPKKTPRRVRVSIGKKASPALVKQFYWLLSKIPLQQNPKNLREAHFHVRALVKMHGVYKSDLAFFERHDEGMGAGAIAEEADAIEHAAGGDAGAGENNSFARSEIFRFVNALGILDAHGGNAFVVLRL